MFKTCMKTYFGNLKHVFTVLGVMFIFALIGMSVFIKSSGTSLQAVAGEIAKATEGLDFSVIGQRGGFFILIESLMAYAYEIVAQAMTAIITLVLNVIILIGTFLLGTYVSNLVVILFGRYEINHDNIFKVIVEQLFRFICIVFCLFVIGLIGYLCGFKVALILLAIYPIGYCFIALFSAWVTCGKKNRAPWSEVVTFKNMLLLLASNLLEIVMTAAMAVIIFCLFDVIVAVVAAIALFVLVTATTNLNAYAFVYKKGSEMQEKAVVNEINEVAAIAETETVTAEAVKVENENPATATEQESVISEVKIVEPEIKDITPEVKEGEEKP